jgi:haloalkane dehalogenase
MKILKTPQDRFENLMDYPFSPNLVEVGDSLNMHYIDEGTNNNSTILLLHGEPTWSYLYRKMIPIFVKAGFRVIAPDLIGFGKSDKFESQEAYSYQKHMDWLSKFIQILDLHNITLVCQDWGGLLGIRLAAENSERFKAIVAANTFLPTGDQKVSDAFFQWQNYSQNTPVFPTGQIVSRGCVHKLTAEEVAAYDAPFPDESYKAAARIFPKLVPTNPHDSASEANRAAWQILKKWEKPFLTCFSDSDPITAGGDKVFQKLIPGCFGQLHTTITEAGHFLQEDKGEKWAEIIVEFVNNLDNK